MRIAEVSVTTRSVQVVLECDLVASRTYRKDDVRFVGIGQAPEPPGRVGVDDASVAVHGAAVDGVQRGDPRFHQGVFPIQPPGHFFQNVRKSDAFAPRKVVDRVAEIRGFVSVFFKNRGVEIHRVRLRESAFRRVAVGVGQENLAGDGDQFLVRYVAGPVAGGRRDGDAQQTDQSFYHGRF